MEVRFVIIDIAREVTIETEASADDIAAQVRAAVADGSVAEFTDDKGRRVLIPGSRIAYVDLGTTTSRPVGFGAV